jgi:hypothetical protein
MLRSARTRSPVPPGSCLHDAVATPFGQEHANTSPRACGRSEREPCNPAHDHSLASENGTSHSDVARLEQQHPRAVRPRSAARGVRSPGADARHVVKRCDQLRSCRRIQDPDRPIAIYREQEGGRRATCSSDGLVERHLADDRQFGLRPRQLPHAGREGPRVAHTRPIGRGQHRALHPHGSQRRVSHLTDPAW